MNGAFLRKVAGEAVSAAMFLLAVVSSRVMGERLSGGNNGITFAVNTAVVAAMAVALMFAFGPVSGAHFNPAVSFATFLRRRLGARDLIGYVVAQLLGAFVGVGVSLVIYGKPDFHWSNPPRATVPEIVGEGVATFGLICVLAGCARVRSRVTSFAVGGYLGATYWFTESTSFANPAVTIAKGLTATSSSIHPGDISLIVSAQLLGAALAGLFFRWLSPKVDGVSAKRPALVVFACTHGGALAQVAVGAFEALADGRAMRAMAATPFPEARPPAQLVAAMGSRHPSARPPVPLSDDLQQDADVLVTIGEPDEWAPFVTGDAIHWTLPHLDPTDAEHWRELIEALRARARMLVHTLGVERVRVLRPVTIRSR